MGDIILSSLNFIRRAIGAVLDIARFITNMQTISRWVTGSNKIIAVPPDPKPLPPAAQRALAEAEERERLRELEGAEASPGAHAASGTVQAS
jgi:hypothetical protein